MPTVSAVVVHHANVQDTLSCVASLISAERIPDKIVVVDNSERDVAFSEYNVPATQTSKHQVELSFSPNACAPVYKVYWIRTKNLGYAAALNAGINFQTADYYWLLNNDLVVKHDALKNLLDQGTRNVSKRYGIVGCKVMFHDRPDVINAVGGKFNKWKAGGFNVGANQRDEKQFDVEDIDIDYPYGAAMFVSQTFIDDVGLLDESYFLYFEELDWTMRGNAKGFQTGYCPTCVVYHKQGASTGKKIKQAHRTSETAHWHYTNLIRFYRKHHPSLIVVPFLRLGGLTIKRFWQRRADESKLIFNVMLGRTRP